MRFSHPTRGNDYVTLSFRASREAAPENSRGRGVFAPLNLQRRSTKGLVNRNVGAIPLLAEEGWMGGQ